MRFETAEEYHKRMKAESDEYKRRDRLPDNKPVEETA